jgi:hypothetical protein
MKRLMVAILLIAVAAPLAAQTRASAGRMGPVSFDFEVPKNLSEYAIAEGSLPEHAQQAVIDFLGLSPSQVASWNELLDETRAMAEPLRIRAEEIQAEIEAEFASGSPNAEVVGQLVIERRAVGEELATIHRDYVDQFEHVILTEDQHKRYHFVRGAARVQPIIPPFRLYGLIPQR